MNEKAERFLFYTGGFALACTGIAILVIAGAAVYKTVKTEGATINKVQLSIPPAPKKK